MWSRGSVFSGRDKVRLHRRLSPQGQQFCKRKREHQERSEEGAIGAFITGHHLIQLRPAERQGAYKGHISVIPLQEREHLIPVQRVPKFRLHFFLLLKLEPSFIKPQAQVINNH